MSIKRGKFQRRMGGAVQSAGQMGDVVMATHVGRARRKSKRKRAEKQNFIASTRLRAAAGLAQGSVRQYEGVLGQYQQMATRYAAADAKNTKLTARATRATQQYKGLTKQRKRTERRIKSNDGVGDMDRYGNIVKRQGKAYKRSVRLGDKAQLSSLGLKRQYKSLTAFESKQKSALQKTKQTRRRYNKLRKRYT